MFTNDIPLDRSACHKAIARRVLVGVIALAWFLHAASPLRAESPRGAPGDTRAGDNPLLLLMERKEPALRKPVEAKLGELKSLSPPPNYRGDDQGPPTPAERAQLAQNPDFDQAYHMHPAGTLELLRWLNERLR